MEPKRLKKCIVKILGNDQETVVGTGFFVSPKGFILTCHHVIADLEKLVIVYGNESHNAIWRPDLSYPERDLAVLIVDSDKLEMRIPDIQPDDDFGVYKEDISGFTADAYGFPHSRLENFQAGFNIHGTFAPGQQVNIPPDETKKQRIESMEAKYAWNFLPEIEVEVYNIENAEAQPGASGSPVLCSEIHKVVGLITASELKQKRAYVIKWENILPKWSDFPKSPPLPELTEYEWAVNEAIEIPDFLQKINDLRQIIAQTLARKIEDIVITLYARSFRYMRGVGTFEYDLLYYWNLFDPTSMFGPIISGDERTNFAQDNKLWKRILYPESPKKGGFVDREKIRDAMWLKLGHELWRRYDFDTREISDSEDICGLMFVNLRGPGWLNEDNIKHSVDLRQALNEIEMIVRSIIKKREVRSDRRMLRLFHAFRPPNKVDELANAKAEAITPHDINIMFSALFTTFEEISGNTNLYYTIFTYDGKKNLHWLWSNGPTSVGATISLDQTALDNTDSELSLIAYVALKTGHIPRVVHHLQSNETYRNRAIITAHGSKAQSNLIVPILSNRQGRELLGIIDIQGLEQTEFDTDDVQLIYEIVSRYISNFVAKLLENYSIAPTLLEPELFLPFAKKELHFDIQDLLRLNYSSMKYLFHWDKIRKLIVGEEVEFPSTVEVWPSMKCSHYCVWCRTQDDRRLYENGNGYISNEGLSILAHDIASQEDVDLLISGGGEPLMHPGIDEFMKILQDEATLNSLGIFTNGTRPKNFAFWEYFFSLKCNHTFIRVSFNGHDPETYNQVQFGNREPNKSQMRYAEARKIVLDLLAMRPDTCTVAIGSTIHSHWLDTVEQQIEHAKRIGVDFIQIRPELIESSRSEKEAWQDIAGRVEIKKKEYVNDERFAVIYTDSERAYKDHDYDVCYAMYLAPAIIPNPKTGLITILPCSYAVNKVGRVPKLGIMDEGVTLSAFWQALNAAMTNRESKVQGVYSLRTKPIDPRMGCPQCRYHMLNRRIIALKEKIESVHLVTQLVKNLEEDPYNLNSVVISEIESIWKDKSVIDVIEAKSAFEISKRLGIRPSL